MKAKEEEFIVTQEWLEEMGACRDGLQAFKHHFPNGGEALEVLKRCGEELGYEDLDYTDFTDFGVWLVSHLPTIYPPLVLNTFIGNLFYPDDVYIKSDISIQEFMYIKGSLKVDGKLTVKTYGEVYTNKDIINADEVNLDEYAYLCSQIKANSISLRHSARILGEVTADNINLSGDAKISKNVIAKVINFKGGFIWGNVDADEIINDGGFIGGDVNTIKIENINGGSVAGKITYKRSDEHNKASY